MIYTYRQCFILYREDSDNEDDIFYSRDVTGHGPVPVGKPPCVPARQVCRPAGQLGVITDGSDEEDSDYESEREDSDLETMTRPKTAVEMMSELAGFVTRINVLQQFITSVPALDGTATRRKVDNTVSNSKCYVWALLSKYAEDGHF